MIGIIVSGHAQFAEGVTSSLNLIAGKQKDYEIVNYDGGATEEFTKQLKAAVDKLFSVCDNVVILTDITGGTPFKMAALMTQERDNLRVVGGLNVGLLIEIAMTRNIESDVDALLDAVVENGKNSIVTFKMIEDVEDEEPTDGI